MALSDDGGADLECLTVYRFGGATPALHSGLDVEDGDTSDHRVTVSSRESRGNADPVVIGNQ